MSFGKMRSFIDIVETSHTQDAEGFAVGIDTVLASVRAYKEERHGNKLWANRATFSTATVLFRFRIIPSVTITEKLAIICDGVRYRILSAENVREKGLYIECMCDRLEPSQN